MESKGPEQTDQFFHYRWENNVGIGRKTAVGKERVWGLCCSATGLAVLNHFHSYCLGNQILFFFKEAGLSQF